MSQSATARHLGSHHPTLDIWPLAPAAISGSLEQVKTGSVFIKRGTPLSRSLALPLRRIGGWNLITGVSASELDRLLRSQGWHLFFLVPPVEAGGCALNFHAALRKALLGVFRQVEARSLNAAEINDLRGWRFFNVHYVRLTAYPRHVRDSPLLFPRSAPSSLGHVGFQTHFQGSKPTGALVNGDLRVNQEETS